MISPMKEVDPLALVCLPCVPITVCAYLCVYLPGVPILCVPILSVPILCVPILCVPILCVPILCVPITGAQKCPRRVSEQMLTPC